jgi:hypothetical protein
METSKVEDSVLEPVISKWMESKFVELNDLQLAFVGGGIGNTII